MCKYLHLQMQMLHYINSQPMQLSFIESGWSFGNPAQWYFVVFIQITLPSAGLNPTNKPLWHNISAHHRSCETKTEPD